VSPLKVKRAEPPVEGALKYPSVLLTYMIPPDEESVPMLEEATTEPPASRFVSRVNEPKE
jgi:hypothetical protein